MAQTTLRPPARRWSMLTRFLLITAASFALFVVGVVFHNLVYGLTHIEEPFFFILAVIVAPVGFVLGAVGSIVWGVREWTERRKTR